MTKILIVGDGLIGTLLRHQLTSKISNNDVIKYTSRKVVKRRDCIFLDLLSLDLSVFGEFETGDFLIFTAAVSSPDECEKKPDLAYKINVTSTNKVIEKAISIGMKVIFLSSDVVYSNCLERIITETTPPCSSKAYGEMKIEVENEFKNQTNLFVLRLSYVIAKTDKFTHYLTETISRGGMIELIHPLYRRVVYIDDVVNIIHKLVSKWPNSGLNLLNVGGPQLLSRYDLYCIYCSVLQKHYRHNFLNVSDGFFESRGKVIDMQSIWINEIIEPTYIKEAYNRELSSLLC